MKIGFLLFIFLAMIICQQSVAQTPLATELYDRNTIHIYHGFWGNGFVKNGQIIPLGTFGSNLTGEMKGSRYALEEMEKARKYKIIGATSGAVATAVQIASIIIYIIDKDYVSKLGFQLTTIGIGATAGMLSVGYNRLATGATNRAVWLYNRDVMTGRLRYETEEMRGW